MYEKKTTTNIMAYIAALLEQVAIMRDQLSKVLDDMASKEAEMNLVKNENTRLKEELYQVKIHTCERETVQEEETTNATTTATATTTTSTPDKTPAISFNLDTAGITVTPISKTEKKQTHLPGGMALPDSRRDYNEQCERLQKGQVMCWDDADANKTKVGDLFAFRHQGDCVEVMQVVEVNGTEERLPSWSRNVGHSKRNVVIITNPLCIISWNEWTTFDWHASGPLLGTQRVANEEKRRNIIDFVNKKITAK